MRACACSGSRRMQDLPPLARYRGARAGARKVHRIPRAAMIAACLEIVCPAALHARAGRSPCSDTEFRRISQQGDQVCRRISVPAQLTYNELLCNTAIVTSSVVVREKTGAVSMPDARYDDMPCGCGSCDKATWQRPASRPDALSSGCGFGVAQQAGVRSASVANSIATSNRSGSSVRAGRSQTMRCAACSSTRRFERGNLRDERKSRTAR